jgi:hypothetical protein
MQELYNDFSVEMPLEISNSQDEISNSRQEEAKSPLQLQLEPQPTGNESSVLDFLDSIDRQAEAAAALAASNADAATATAAAEAAIASPTITTNKGTAAPAFNSAIRNLTANGTTNGNTSSRASSSATSIGSSNAIRLEDLFSSFFAPEERELICEHCQQPEGRTNVISKLSSLPNVLIVHLKRFKYDRKYVVAVFCRAVCLLLVAALLA